MRLYAFLLLFTVGAGCSAPAAPTFGELEMRAAQNPTDADALRDLGIAHLERRELGEAAQALGRAFELRPADAETVYFLALTQEALGRRDLALDLLQGYATFPAGEWREAMRGRYGVLLRDETRAQLRTALAREDTLADVSGTGALAVLPFQYGGGNDDYAPLGRGLAELITNDLAGIEGLTVVERLRLTALLQEFEIARTGDPATVPRVGRLLRAERVASGVYTVDQERLRIDASLFDGGTGEGTDLAAAEGGLPELLAVQDAVVYGLLQTLGIEPTAADRARVERAPTTSLRAFLLYSQGLQAEDAGDLLGASRFFGQAADLDGGFGAAAQRRDEARAVAAQSGDATELAQAAAAEAGTTSGKEGEASPAAQRSATLGRSLGVQIVPGADSRQPAAEGSAAGIFGALPPPPPPPSRDDTSP